MQRKLRELPRPCLCWRGGERSQNRVSFKCQLPLGEAEHRSRTPGRPSNEPQPCSSLSVRSCCSLGRSQVINHQEERGAPLPGQLGPVPKGLAVGQYTRLLSLLPGMGRLSRTPFCPLTSIYSTPLLPIGICLRKMQMSSFRKRETFLPTHGEGQ